MKKIFKYIFTTTVILAFILNLTITAFASNPKQVISENHVAGHRIVKVGWFYSDGVHNLNKEGMPSGFDYDYLHGIAQYTNWDYEYYVGSWSECYNWLKEGKIDLLGVVNKTNERTSFFDYSYTSVGTEFCSLLVDANNPNYAYEDFEHFDGMTIGIEKGTFQVNVLKDYAKMHGFKYKTKIYPTLADGEKGVSHGEIDALLASNTDVIKGFKSIAQFNPIPFYFATTKGNDELLNELNYGINQLFVYYPNFSNYLYSKYYNTNISSKIAFTPDELSYIESNPEINVLTDPIWYPIESYNTATKRFEGIVPDLLKVITEKSELKFNYLDTDNSINALNKIKDNPDNSITSITYDYSWANENNTKITQPIIDASIMYVTKEKSTMPKTVALVEVDYITEMVKNFLPNLTPIYFDSMAECVYAVKDGNADCAYLNNYEAEYYMSMPIYESLKFHTTDLFRQKICLGVGENADPRLFSIISKCLQNISDNEIQNIIYKNSFHNYSMTFYEYIKNNPLYVIISLSALFILIIFSYYLSVKNKIKNSHLIEIENQRYNQLAEITNEHVYEYNYKTDTLTFNNALENFLGGESQIYNYSNYIETNKSIYNNSAKLLYDCFNEKQDLIKEINIPLTDNTPCWYQVITKIIKDEKNNTIYAIGKIKNIQVEYEEKQQLLEQAKCDSLTGIYNAMTFKLLSQKYLTKNSTLLIIDIDNFKDVNDRYGHLSGDIAIVSVTKLLTRIFNDIGIPGRVGGDEFGVFIPNSLKAEKLEELCNELLQETSNIKLKCNGKKFSPVTLSIGGYTSSKLESFKTMYQKSDEALYEVKKQGRNNYKITKM